MVIMWVAFSVKLKNEIVVSRNEMGTTALSTSEKKNKASISPHKNKQSIKTPNQEII